MEWVCKNITQSPFLEDDDEELNSIMPSEGCDVQGCLGGGSVQSEELWDDLSSSSLSLCVEKPPEFAGFSRQ